MHDSNLDYPVHIEVGKTFGSGFYLNTPGHTWLITAKHVLFKVNGDLINASAKLTSFTQKFANRLTADLDLVDLQAAGHLVSHALADVAAVKLGDKADGRLTTHPGVTVQAAPGIGMTGLGYDNVTSIDHVGIANDVYLFGYPLTIGVGQIEPLKPLLRKGCIAGVNSLNRTIIVDAPVYQGNSGGLVVEVASNPFLVTVRGIGVVSQFCPFVEQMQSLQFGTVNTSIENSGYAVIEPIDKVFDMIGVPIPGPAAQ